jgi:UDP-glucose 4-epimerase
MRFLVSGGAGFLGTALANTLVEDRHQVRVLDDLSNGDRANLNPQIAFTQGDINNVPRLWSVLQGVDCVYHLAARVSVAESMLYPRDYNSTNVGGTVSLMEAMRDAGVGRVVFVSSGAIYGHHAQQPVHELDPARPDSPYAVSKWAAERYIDTIGALWGMETVALRVFNAYGPGQPLPVSHAPVVSRFLQQALSGGSLVIHGEGRQSRDFVYLTDVVAALVAAATAQGVDRTVINVGRGVETSIAELVDTIERVIGRKVNRVYNPAKNGGVERLVADIERARILLDFRPQIDLEQGLSTTLAVDPRFQAMLKRLPQATH